MNRIVIIPDSWEEGEERANGMKWNLGWEKIGNENMDQVYFAVFIVGELESRQIIPTTQISPYFLMGNFNDCAGHSLIPLNGNFFYKSMY